MPNSSKDIPVKKDPNRHKKQFDAMSTSTREANIRGNLALQSIARNGASPSRVGLFSEQASKLNIPKPKREQMVNNMAAVYAMNNPPLPTPK